MFLFVLTDARPCSDGVKVALGLKKTLRHKDLLMPQQQAHLHPVREGVETGDVRGETEKLE